MGQYVNGKYIYKDKKAADAFLDKIANAMVKNLNKVTSKEKTSKKTSK